jgi:hypothetical protein
MSSSTIKMEKIENLLNGDKSDIRNQLIYAGLLIMIFEQFKKYVLETIDSFFSNEIEIREEAAIYKRGEKFKHIIKNHGKGEKGQHTNDAFRAALKWLLTEFNVISKKEFDEIEKLYLIRNNIGHELFRIILDDRKDLININDIYTVLNIYLKIYRWWLKEIEASTNPSFAEYDHDLIDFGSAELIETLLLRKIIDKVLNDECK